jgi:hypothetical protein
MSKVLRWSLAALFSMQWFDQVAYAQNETRIEEEALLDQERKRRVDELLRAREEEEARIKNMNLSDAELEKSELVEVEPNNILPSDLSSLYALVPYKIRRPTWGHLVTVGYSLFNPYNYESDFPSASLIGFEDLYAASGIIEVAYNYKYNFRLGSLGLEAAYGMFNTTAQDTSFGDLELSLQQLRVGVRYNLDNILYEPYIVPYVGAGMYSILYKESLASDSFNGQTDFAPYFYIGGMIQLNWFDKSSAVEAYADGGIENTFLYVEGRQYMASSVGQDPDFGTDLNVSAGLTLEF